MAITQTISALPTAGARGVDIRDVFVTKQEAFQNALTEANGFVAQVNTFATQVNTLQADVNAKQTATATSASNAAISETNASASETNAATSETNANTAANNAANSATSAATQAGISITKAGESSDSAAEALVSRNKANLWAEEDEDVEVETDTYSAKHWAMKAQEVVSSGIIDDTSPDLLRVYSSDKTQDLHDSQQSEIDGLASSKQDTLISGTSIKTINSTTLLGSGNITLDTSIINIPSITYPTTGAIDFNGAITCSAMSTSTNYSGTHDYTNWQLSYTSDFAIIQFESTVSNLTSWTPSTGLALQVCYVRVRQGSDGHRSNWSSTISFTTPNVYINTPTVTTTGTPSSVPASPTITTSAFSVYNGSDTHYSTDWQVIRVSDNSVVWSSMANTTDKLSITVPSGYLVVSTAYIFKARHNGSTYGSSSYGSVNGTTSATFAYDYYLAVGNNASPFITIYGRDSDTFTKLADPSVLPTGTGSGIAFSNDGVYMAVVHYISPFITIYKRSGDTFTKLANPSVLPPNSGMGVAFSSDGVYLAVASWASPFIIIYKRSGDTFTKLADPSVLPTGGGMGVAFSSDGVYLAVVHDISPFITIYKRSGDTFTKLANPSVLPPSTGSGVAFSNDGVYMAVVHYTSPYIAIYKRSGDTFTKLADPSVLPTGNSRGIAFSSDGVYLAVGNESSPYITIYKRSGDTFTKLADPSVLPTGNSRGIAFYPSAL